MRKLELTITDRFYVDDTCNIKATGNFTQSFFKHYKNVVKPDYQVSLDDYKKIFHCIRVIVNKSLLLGIPISLWKFGTLYLKRGTVKGILSGKLPFKLAIKDPTVKNYRTTFVKDLIRSVFTKVANEDYNRYEVEYTCDLIKNGNKQEIMKNVNSFDNIIL